MRIGDGLYRNLQIHLDSMPIGFPATEDNSDIKVLKAFFTPEEAELATSLNYLPESLTKIHKKMNLKEGSLEEIQKSLDKMVEKKIIFKMVNPKNNKTSYGILAYAIGFFETHVNRLTKDMAQAFENYGEVFTREFLGEETGIPQMRTIPINSALTHENRVMNYEKAQVILESIEGPYAVAPCVCVQARELVGKSCKHDIVERCMVNSQSYIDNGDAREITKDEALEILNQAEESGFVIQPGNSKSSGGFCLCCSCCCGIISNAKKLENPARLFATNFYSEIETERCTGCGTCIDLCPMDAIQLNETSSIDRERCIGCGVCVPKCPSEAITLKNKENTIFPPENSNDLLMKIIKKKIELKKHT